jgi:hypothetical protein
VQTAPDFRAQRRQVCRLHGLQLLQVGEALRLQHLGIGAEPLPLQPPRQVRAAAAAAVARVRAVAELHVHRRRQLRRHAVEGHPPGGLPRGPRCGAGALARPGARPGPGRRRQRRHRPLGPCRLMAHRRLQPVLRVHYPVSPYICGQLCQGAVPLLGSLKRERELRLGALRVVSGRTQRNSSCRPKSSPAGGSARQDRGRGTGRRVSAAAAHQRRKHQRLVCEPTLPHAWLPTHDLRGDLPLHVCEPVHGHGAARQRIHARGVRSRLWRELPPREVSHAPAIQPG